MLSWRVDASTYPPKGKRLSAYQDRVSRAYWIRVNGNQRAVPRLGKAKAEGLLMFRAHPLPWLAGVRLALAWGNRSLHETFNSALTLDVAGRVLAAYGTSKALDKEGHKAAITRVAFIAPACAKALPIADDKALKAALLDVTKPMLVGLLHRAKGARLRTEATDFIVLLMMIEHQALSARPVSSAASLRSAFGRGAKMRWRRKVMLRALKVVRAAETIRASGFFVARGADDKVLQVRLRASRAALEVVHEVLGWRVFDRR